MGAHRVKRMASHLCPHSAAALSSRAHVSVPPGSSPRPPSHLDHLLEQNDDGSLKSHELEELERLELEAAAHKDYHHAALLCAHIRPTPSVVSD